MHAGRKHIILAFYRYMYVITYLDKERVTKSQSTLKVLTEGIIQETAGEQTNTD
jgi:hypothetical protein